MSLGAHKGNFNLEMLSKLFHVIAKIAFKNQTETQTHIEPKQSSFARFVDNLKAKLQIAFTDVG